MPTRAQLVSEVMGWLDRRDIEPLVGGWIVAAEVDMRAQLRARCMIVRATQAVDAPFISLPADFASMEAIRDTATGKLLDLEDDFTGPLPGDGGCATAYRLVGECIEFLPHPWVPSAPPLVGWQPQLVTMTWYQAPKPLVDSTDTNKILEQHYQCYLFGALKYGAMFELDDDRQAQTARAFTEAVIEANTWKETAQYSGAPLRSVQATVF